MRILKVMWWIPVGKCLMFCEPDGARIEKVMFLLLDCMFVIRFSFSGE